jgi:IrrE N-terminal-like domain
MSQGYYEELKALARQIRQNFSLSTPRVQLSDLRAIYKHYGIVVDLWPRNGVPPTVKLKGLKGAFFFDECGSSVLINRFLPEEPRIFTMGHELKHFLKDRDYGELWCGNDNVKDEIEIGAEIFSAELIFPDADFRDSFCQLVKTSSACAAEKLVHLKRQTRTTMSYAALIKKAVFLKFAVDNDFRRFLGMNLPSYRSN